MSQRSLNTATITAAAEAATVSGSYQICGQSEFETDNVGVIVIEVWW